MTLIKRLIVGVIILIITAGAILFGLDFYLKRSLPLINGTIQVKGLKGEVRIVRDKYGVPHIYGKDIEDVFFALGFIHAQERLWQMDLMRRMAEGRLAEIFGDVPFKSEGSYGNTTLEQDKFKRIIGFKYLGERIEKVAKGEIKLVMDAYVKGINEFLRLNSNKLPPEFILLGYKPEKWRIADTIALGKFLSWNLTSNYDYELLRYLIMKKLGREKAEEMLPKHHDKGHFIINEDINLYPVRNINLATWYKSSHIKWDATRDIISNGVKIPESRSVKRKFDWRLPHPYPRGKRIGVSNENLTGDCHALRARNDIAFASHSNLNSGQFAASNSWVVSGKMTKSGKPILANDPHLLHTLPSIFFALHLKCPSVNITGVTFPGIPFIMIGHNEDIAWGATTAPADVTDIYVEKRHPLNPSMYLFKGKWQEFKKRKEVIKVKKGKGFENIELEVLSTIHGPVINSIYLDLKESPPLSLRWAGYDAFNDGASYFALMRAKNINEVIDAISLNESPIQNWIFADRKGNIGYLPCGLIPIRKNGDGLFPVEGWSGKYEWEGFIPPSEIPQMSNPSEQFIVTANNKVIDEEKYKYIFSYDYSPYYRSERIRQLLAGRKNLTLKDMKKIQLDNYSLKGERLAKYFIKAYEKVGKKEKIYDEAISELKLWDFRTDIHSCGSSIFFKAYSLAIKKMVGDELGELTELYFSSRRFETTIDNIIEEGKSKLFDNINTPQVEDRDVVLFESFTEAVNFLQEKFGKNPSDWQWGKLNTITFSHPFAAKRLLHLFFSFGPYPAEGERNTVNMNYSSFLEDSFNVTAGPVLRFVIDMSDTSKAEFIIDTGQSGHFKSKHFSDMLRLFMKKKTVKMLFSNEDIEKYKEGELELVPERGQR